MRDLIPPTLYSLSIDFRGAVFKQVKSSDVRILFWVSFVLAD
jgi:hypothetical protein